VPFADAKHISHDIVFVAEHMAELVSEGGVGVNTQTLGIGGAIDGERAPVGGTLFTVAEVPLVGTPAVRAGGGCEVGEVNGAGRGWCGGDSDGEGAEGGFCGGGVAGGVGDGSGAGEPSDLVGAVVGVVPGASRSRDAVGGGDGGGVGGGSGGNACGEL
jgi:hypothetical protein